MNLEKINPATAGATDGAARKRIPMSVPTRKLEAAEIPGYHLYWFYGTADQIQRATEGGYEFVDEREVRLNAASLGSNSAAGGNTDMGSRVSVLAGADIGHDGQPVRLILMKIKLEWYEEDQKILEKRNEQIAAALRGGLLGAEQDGVGDTQHRYVDRARTKIPDLFTPKRAKAA